MDYKDTTFQQMLQFIPIYEFQKVSSGNDIVKE